MNTLSLENNIINKIYLIRNTKVMLDKDLAEMYSVEVKMLNQSVKRNITRFPNDFMFQLNDEEWNSLKSQFVTSKRGGVRKLPYAFTEQGVAMLSSVLKSEIAINVNIAIIRVFSKMKEILIDNKEILLRLEKIERSLISKEEDITIIFNIIKELIVKPITPKTHPIGFKYPNKK